MPYRPWIVLGAILFATTASAAPLRPADVIGQVRDDARSIPDASRRNYTRYLSCYNLPPAERAIAAQLVDFALNSLSRRRVMAFVAVVPGTDGTLLRVSLDAYGWTPETWDGLAKRGSGPTRSVKKVDQPEPYFHQVLRRGGSYQTTKRTRKVPHVGPDGRRYVDSYGQPAWIDETYEAREKQAVTTELVHGPWLPQPVVVEAATLLYTDYPVLRADWFLANALITPAYYELLGLKSLKDFQDFTRFRERDEDLAVRGVVIDSEEVALHQRAARFTPTVMGAYWETFDYLTSVGEDDLLVDLKKKRRDAGEIIANGPNGLQVYALVNGQDALVDFADPNAAIDRNTPWANKLVWSGISCMTCHSEGMKDVADEVRVLSRPPFALFVRDKHDFQEVIDLFSTPIEQPIGLTKATYAGAVAKSTRGLKTPAFAGTLQRAFLRYIQDSVTLDAAALEVGCEPEVVIEVLGRAKSVDHTLIQLLALRPIRRDQWEYLGFSQLATLIYQRKSGTTGDKSP